MYAISNAIFAMLETSKTNVGQYDELYEKENLRTKLMQLTFICITE